MSESTGFYHTPSKTHNAIGKLDFVGFLRSLKFVCQKIEQKRRDILKGIKVYDKEVVFREIVEYVLSKCLMPIII